MPSPLSALFLTPAERLARALSDARMGLPCAVMHHGARAVIIAVEPLHAQRLVALQALFGTPELVITANRAQAIMKPGLASDRNAQCVRIKPPQTMDMDWLARVSDSTLDNSAPSHGPLHVIREGGDTLQTFALRLVKSAHLLPAVLVFPLDAGQALPSGLELAEIDIQQASGQMAALPMYDPVAAARFPLRAAEVGTLHVFRDSSGASEHYAFEIGTPDRALPVLARLHSACFTGDVLGSLKCDCGPQLDAALARMGTEGAGVLLYLNQEGRGIGLANKMRVYDLQAQGFDTVEANHRLGFEDDERDFRVASVMLRSLGFGAVRLLTNNPAKVEAFRFAGIEITEQLPLRVGKNVHNSAYLATKAVKSGHVL